jgi:hypothetical protein
VSVAAEDSTAFQVLAGLLSGPPEDAALFILGYPIDRFETEIPDFAIATGIPVDDLRELAHMARQGNDPNAAVRPEQHVVSQVLLRNWCDVTPQGPRMGYYSLAFGAQKPASPVSVAKVEDFIEIDSSETEDLWGTVETRLPDAMVAIGLGKGLTDAMCVQTLKDLVALHYARSLDVLDAYQASIPEFILKAKAAYLADHALLDRLHQMTTGQTGGLVDDAERVAFVNDFFSRFESIHVSGSYFRFRVEHYFKEAKKIVSTSNVQILHAQAGSEFLIGDVPVVTSTAGAERRGIQDGVPIGDAATIVMPLSPEISVAIDAVATEVTVDSSYVRQLNIWQLLGARKAVFMRKDSPLMAFVEAVRPKTGRPSRSRHTHP